MVAALEEGRDLIVPDRHRAAALRLAWARRQLAAGSAVWSSPSIHTWEAWLTRQWREAAQRGAAAPAQLLDASQERALWESVLAQLAHEDEDATSLTQHAGAMMLAAARATQAGIDPQRLALGREESLFARALQAVRRECQARGLLSLRLAGADALGFLEQVRAPRIAGERSLTALQAALGSRCWPGETLLLPSGDRQAASVQRLRAVDLEQELAACAAWCRAHVERDRGARLLVMSACIEPSLSIQAAMLWRALSGGAALEENEQARWLAVEGGEPLLHQALAADALAVLELAGSDDIDIAALQALLRSPYFGIGEDAPRLRLAAWLAEQGLARWPREGLLGALQGLAAREPAAGGLTAWFSAALQSLGSGGRLAATEWARRFTTVLDAAAFARAAPLDSREQQRLTRWNALLDEFASLDAVLPPLSLPSALARLRRLATQARHQAASADAAITLTASLADPVAAHDGIWVLGLAESRWPAAPRPDPWVPLAEQRQAQWPESGATQRREQALWALRCWQARAGELVLSHALREGDLVHRPAALAGEAALWLDCEAVWPAPVAGLSHEASDQALRPMACGTGDGARAEDIPLLPGGTSRLVAQQACAFRAQAQWRLGAEPPPLLSQGVPPSLRGRLLHRLLQELWQQLRDQQRLLALDETSEADLVSLCWEVALRETPSARWLSPAVLGRERERALRTVRGVLRLERARLPFTVEHNEQSAQWQGAGARVALRIDRIDRIGDDAVLIDYKSGAPGRIGLHEAVLQPLQLALYATALAQQGRPVVSAVLLNLHPAEPEFAGVTAREGVPAPRLRAVDDWQQATANWQQQLVALMAQHLSGEATLTLDRTVCRRCHLPALCRRAGAEDDLDADDEDAVTSGPRADA